MKSLVLFLFLLVIVLVLAQVGKHHNGRWEHWLPPPQQHFHPCHNRGFPPNTWPKVAMHHMILPGPSPGNVAWRHTQGIDNWNNPFHSVFFGYPNFFNPWGPYQPQYQGGMLPRYPGRLPLPTVPQFGSIHGHWPIPPHLGPTHGQWPGHMGPTNRQWPMFPHVAPQIPPYYLADRNNYYVK